MSLTLYLVEIIREIDLVIKPFLVLSEQDRDAIKFVKQNLSLSDEEFEKIDVVAQRIDIDSNSILGGQAGVLPSIQNRQNKKESGLYLTVVKHQDRITAVFAVLAKTEADARHFAEERRQDMNDKEILAQELGINFTAKMSLGVLPFDRRHTTGRLLPVGKKVV